MDLSSGRPKPVRDPRRGIVYIVTAGGGKPIYDIARNPLHAATAEAFHFVRVDVRGDTARYAVIEAESGRILDRFVLRRR